MIFTIYLHYCAIPVLNISIRAFIWHSELLKWHNSYLIIAVYIFILFLPWQWIQCTKVAQLFFHFFRCAYPTHSLLYWWERKDRKEIDCGLSCLSLFFCGIISSINGWLIQGSTETAKDTTCLLGLCVSLGGVALFLYLKHVLVQTESMAFWAVSTFT